MVNNPGKKVVTPYDDLTYRIIGCTMAMHRALGPSLREDSSQRALAFSLKEAGLGFEVQQLNSVFSAWDNCWRMSVVSVIVPRFLWGSLG